MLPTAGGTCLRACCRRPWQSTALASIDHATLALHLGRNADSQMERIERARQAQASFESALQHLEKADPALKASEAWRIWYDEAHNGLAAAQERLAQLGP